MGSAGPVTIRDEALLVAILKNQEALCDVLASRLAGVEIVKTEYVPVAAAGMACNCFLQ